MTMAIICIAGIGLAAAVTLAVADRCLSVKEDPRIGLVTAAAIVITNTTAPDIPTAVSVFLDTPRNGQHPRKRLRTKLFTRTAPTNIMR